MVLASLVGHLSFSSQSFLHIAMKIFWTINLHDQDAVFVGFMIFITCEKKTPENQKTQIRTRPCERVFVVNQVCYCRHSHPFRLSFGAGYGVDICSIPQRRTFLMSSVSPTAACVVATFTNSLASLSLEKKSSYSILPNFVSKDTG